MINNQTKIKKIITELQKWREINKTSYTIFYRRFQKIIGVYFVNEGDEVGILFLNKDYPNSALILELIDSHCHIFNEEILVYTWNQKAIEAYESVVPKFFSLVDL